MVGNDTSFEQQEEIFVQKPGPSNVTRRIQTAKAKGILKVFKAIFNENKAQINI
jgi:hypothetical protein